MHKYMKAIGYSNIPSRAKLQEILNECVHTASSSSYNINEDNTILSVFYKQVSQNFGIAIVGNFDEEDKFTIEYYFPYVQASEISTDAAFSIERQYAQESYEGICEDSRIGVSLIFYIQNMISFLKNDGDERKLIEDATISLSALSVAGIVMMPIQKTADEVQEIRTKMKKRTGMITDARNGDNTAIESLSLEDMDLYTSITKKIKRDDVYTLVDTYFMPFGVECDQYSVLGEIEECKREQNEFTREFMYLLKIRCNELTFDVGINKKDLLGEPEVGRRFKGQIWLQGYVNYKD